MGAEFLLPSPQAEALEVKFPPGFRMFPAAGHRHDHDILKIELSGETLIHLADSLIHPIMIANRAWYYAYDVDPQVAIETKAGLLERFVSDEALVFATHFPFTGLGAIVRVDTQWQWHPVRE